MRTPDLFDGHEHVEVVSGGGDNTDPKLCAKRPFSQQISVPHIGSRMLNRTTTIPTILRVFDNPTGTRQLSALPFSEKGKFIPQLCGLYTMEPR